ncbi:MAG: DUF3187 family protein [Pseudomonadota bacterium]
MKSVARTTVFVIVFCIARPAVAICSTELGPVAGLFAVGVDNSSTPGLSACLSLANHSTDNFSGNERLVFDGETLRLELGWFQSIEQWTVGVSAPFVRHGSGFLDTPIDSWHTLFGLPNGNRDRRPTNALLFEWDRNNETLLARDASTSGIGDVRLYASRRLIDRSLWQLSLAAAAKLPTGDPDRLTGSGGTDVTLGLRAETSQLFGSERWRLSASAALTNLGDSDIDGLPSAAQVVSATATLRWRASNTTEFGARVRARQRLVRSELREVGDPAVGLDAWIGWRAWGEQQIRIGVSEDLNVDSQPDVVFRLSLGRALP